MPKCKDCRHFKICDDTLFRTSGVHLKDYEHDCIEYDDSVKELLDELREVDNSLASKPNMSEESNDNR